MAAVTLNWKANNAIPVSQQQCYAFEASAAAGAWSGKQTGTYNSTTYTYSGSTAITPTANGTHTYALTCGGTVSGFGSTSTGNVAFVDSGEILYTAKLNASGVATFTAPTTGQTVGTYPVVATYSGDASDMASNSAAVDVTVE